MPNGVIVVGRKVSNILADYRSEEIPDILGAVDHSLTITDKKEFKKALRKQERRFNQYVRQMKELGLFLVIALQGRDGAGKTGTVSVLDEALGHDYKLFKSLPFGPPSQEELAHPYLWKYLKYDFVPEFGQVRVLDRSWQERVLVERVMGFTPEHRIQDSYAELRVHEWAVVRHGGVLVKIWLDITKDEQKRRFEKRAEEKPWKISDSDGIAREHWDDYTPAANELFYRCGTDFAPQHIVSSEDKKYCHITVLEIVNDAMKRRIKEAKAAKKRADKKAGKSAK